MKEKTNINGFDERLKPFAVRATARSVRRRNVMLRTVGIIVLILILLLGFFYAMSAFVNKAGNFTVWVTEDDLSRLTLSNTAEFEDNATILEADIIEQMDNITKAWLPEDIDDVDGCHNGENYIAYTFYMKNMGENEVNYTTQIDIHAVTKEADNAVRVMVIKNGEETVYAKSQKGSNEPEPDTVAFLSETQVLKNTTVGFKPNDVDKYTVVIWLEGNDPECVDNIRGGVVKMSMTFKAQENS